MRRDRKDQDYSQEYSSVVGPGFNPSTERKIKNKFKNTKNRIIFIKDIGGRE